MVHQEETIEPETRSVALEAIISNGAWWLKSTQIYIKDSIFLKTEPRLTVDTRFLTSTENGAPRTREVLIVYYINRVEWWGNIRLKVIWKLSSLEKILT